MSGVVLAEVVAFVALVFGVAGFTLAATITRRVGSRDPIAVPPFWRRLLGIKALPMPLLGEFSPAKRGRQKVAFIANPTKQGVAEVREQALRACSIRYLPQPMWLYTTVEDAGQGATAKALEAGADIVVAIGGDGTVRAVAGVLAGTNVPLAIVPLGTGNLFARNLNLPLGDVPTLLRIALEGHDSRVDVGWLTLDRRASGDPEREPFLVIAGAGMDAEMVAGADERLKRRFGWVAYFFAALKHLRARRISVEISVDGSEPVAGQLRSVLFANVGRLPGGLTVAPDASASDGALDVVSLDARAGIVGWTGLFGNVVAQGAGWRQPDIFKTYAASRIDHARGTTVTVTMQHPEPVQADGESLGMAKAVTARLDPGALVVRTAPDPV